MGVLDFAVAMTNPALMLGAFAVPIEVAAGVDLQIGSWTIDSFPESLVFVPISLVFCLVGPRLLLAWGGLSARFATWLLGCVEPAEMKGEVVDVLSRTGAADAFRLYDELELRLGREPFLSPTRLAATLLALESTGRVLARREGFRTIYALA
jgi:hypothetical protein